MNVIFPTFIKVGFTENIILVYVTNQPSLIVLGKQNKEYKWGKKW